MMNLALKYIALLGVILVIIAIGLAELTALLARQWQK